ncbi:MAG: glycosyltransferase family 2 protein [Lachnospiraceae bacterium]|nr:glycosyltransferase family 2 protein [Lachnospiraceae bacterium]
MKILTIAIPCYNSEEYMEKCIKSILPVGNAVEILIVDDGSTKDRTPQIADSYAARYPDIIRAVHQENGGHGEAVNAGLRNATGLYYKVVDSDDWVNTKGLAKIVSRMQDLEKDGGVDMLLANFVYDKAGARHKRLMRFKNCFPCDEIFEWDNMRNMHQTQYILMHNIFYRTQMLWDCCMELPKHTFYVDNIFAFQPLPYVKRLYYMDVNLYHYFIGREDQSVNEKVMIGRIDQQIRVNEIMIDVMAAEDFSDKSPRLKKYMMVYLSKIMTVTSIMLILSRTEEALAKKEDIWNYLKEKDAELYHSLRYNIFGIFMNLPGKVGRKISIGAYKAAQKFVGFN